MKSHSLRWQLAVSFIVLALGIVALGGIAVFTLNRLNAESQQMAAEMDRQIAHTLQSFSTGASSARVSNQIGQADTAQHLQQPELLAGLQQLEGQGQAATFLQEQHNARQAYLQQRESLLEQMNAYAAQVDETHTQTLTLIREIQNASLAEITAAQEQMLAASRSSSGQSVDALNTTVQETLESVISALGARNELFAAQIAAQSGAEVATITGFLDAVAQGLDQLPVELIGALEIQGMRQLHTTIVDLISAEAGFEAQNPTLTAAFGDFHAALEEAAENVVFDQSFALEDYLGTVAQSISDLIEAQQDMRESMAQVAELEVTASTLNREFFALGSRVEAMVRTPRLSHLTHYAPEVNGLLHKAQAHLVALLDALEQSQDEETTAAFGESLARVFALFEGEAGLWANTQRLVEVAERDAAQTQQADAFLQETFTTMQRDFHSLAEQLESEIAAIVAAGEQAQTFQIILGGAMAIAGIALGVFLPRRISRRLTLIVDDLLGMSERLAHSADAMQRANETQAQTASEQASTLEESSATLEELATMAKSNRTATERANTVSIATEERVALGNERMQKMQTTMTEIESAAQEIGKITKTIEGIAFQTNILALNAAVEAARAGEAGAGFAVVADEVRALALKCSEAAQETSVIIARNTTQTEEGVTAARTMVVELEGISGGIGDLRSVIDEVHRATEEQSSGIEQINKGVMEMSTHTQHSAAAAQEGASNASQTDSEARSLHQLVTQLATYSGARAHHGGAQGHGPSGTAPVAQPVIDDVLSPEEAFRPTTARASTSVHQSEPLTFA